ncbi:hypothetical protein LCGC14_1462910 [marine sediment metagenome]|uniref:Uncharacterized protein n=1 Tax=marine sediment metagenome TaxID=412755 RepID=A0A0F9JEJ7_9ZZZZ|nr:hypothetical protein [Candidatus Aminicenantes bacterium]
MDGDDIKGSNSSMPWFPNEMSLWQRFMCLFGYHKPETRQTKLGHRYGDGSLHDHARMKLRDQCGRCGTLL